MALHKMCGLRVSCRPYDLTRPNRHVSILPNRHVARIDGILVDSFLQRVQYDTGWVGRVVCCISFRNEGCLIGVLILRESYFLGHLVRVCYFRRAPYGVLWHNLLVVDKPS